MHSIYKKKHPRCTTSTPVPQECVQTKASPTSPVVQSKLKTPVTSNRATSAPPPKIPEVETKNSKSVASDSDSGSDGGKPEVLPAELPTLTGANSVTICSTVRYKSKEDEDFRLLLFIAAESWFYMLMVLAILPRPASVIHFFSSLASVSISVSFALSWTFFEERSSSSSSTVFCSPFFFSRYLKAALLFWAFFLCPPSPSP